MGFLPLGLLALAYIALPCLALLWAAGGAEVRRAVARTEIADALLLSLQTSSIALLVSVIVGTPASYLLARLNFPGKGLIESTLILPLVLPPVVGGVALLLAFGQRGVLGDSLNLIGLQLPFTTIAVVMAQVFMAMPFYVQSAKAGFQAVPRHLEEASRTLGRSELSTFLSVTIPLSWPALVSGGVLCWGRALGEFGATIMFAGNIRGVSRTMPLAILTAMQGDLSEAIALAVILLLLSTLIFIAAQVAMRRLSSLS